MTHALRTSEASTSTSLSAEARIDQWKKNLLDLTLRNRLLNHRPSDKSTLHLATQDAHAVYGALLQTTRIQLVPTDGEEATFDGKVLPIDLSEKEFSNRCLKLYRANVNELQESGLSTLFAAIGFLEWREANSSDTARYAPLILMPATLERTRVGGPYHLIGTDETLPNTSLVEKLKSEFGIDLSAFDLPQEADDLPIWFTQVQDAVAEKGFHVRHTMAVAPYRFGKIEMWMDLDKNADALLSNQIVRSIVSGSSEMLPSHDIPEPQEMDTLPAQDDLSVLDSDSSQRAAVRAVIDGANIVLQGPPGTGKSQTITNLIAHALGLGKTVLFVSEKRAALDVVHRRLKEVGLGPFTLNAYANNANKKEIIDQLRAPLEYDWQRPSGSWQAHAIKLGQTRDTLNQHKTLFHSKGPFGETLYQSIVRLMELEENGAPRIPLRFDPLPTTEIYEAQHKDIDQFQQRTQRIGTPNEHPYRYVLRDDWTVTWQRDVQALIEQTRAAGHTLHAQRKAIERYISPNGKASSKVGARMGRAVVMLGECPTVPLKLLQENRDLIDQKVEQITAKLNALQEHKDDISPTFALDLLESPQLKEDHDAVQRWATKLALFAFFALFFVRRRLQAFSQQRALPNNRSLQAPLQHAQQARTLQEELADANEEMQALFGIHWQGEDTDSITLQKTWEWARDFRPVLRDIAFEDQVLADRLQTLATDSEARDDQSEIGRLIQQLNTHYQTWSAHKEALEQKMLLSPAWRKLSTDEQLQTLDTWRDRPDDLQPWCDWLQTTKNIRDLGYQTLTDAVEKGTLPPDQIAAAWHHALRENAWSQACANSPELQAFRGVEHNEVITRFRALDEQARDVAREEIQALIASHLPRMSDPGEMDILRREFQKKTRHKPLRQLFIEAPNVISRLKPCILMSPLAVARYLDASDRLFDLIVFDEASQIPPWDSIGAIARGKQVVIVGDSKQLPPTTFFEKKEQDIGVEDELIDLESILDQAVSAGLPEMTLNWHYRSRHESLIAFSNQAYYYNRLHIFPSPRYNDPLYGLKWVYVKDGVYDRGGTQTNRKEAETICDLIIERLLDPATQNLSIGVVTLSMAQRTLIMDVLDAKRAEYPEIESFFSNARREPLFVRNLENVQGDERDIIFFSVGYGPDAADKMTMNFGPLNNAGGGRRLNVAITRARIQCVVVSSFRYDRIPSTNANPAIQELRGFLEYAHRGPQALIEQVTASEALNFDSPFEQQVYDVLKDAGWTVHSQVGVSGYRLDLAVLHPERPGSYILGVECDGATYHSSQTARDRDRIRQNVLEGLGWTLHRIWSTDWWTQRAATTERLLAAVKQAKIDADNSDPLAHLSVQRRTPSDTTDTSSNGDAQQNDYDEYQDYIEDTLPNRILDPSTLDEPTWPENSSPWKPLPELSGGPKEQFYESTTTHVLNRQVRQILEEYSPLNFDNLARHIAQAWGYRSLGKRIRERIKMCIRAIGGGVRSDGSTWLSKSDYEPYDHFRYVEEHPRELEDVPTKELASAMRWVIRRGFTMTREDLFRQTASIFGSTSLTQKVYRLLEPALDELLHVSQEISVDDDEVQWRGD